MTLNTLESIWGYSFPKIKGPASRRPINRASDPQAGQAHLESSMTTRTPNSLAMALAALPPHLGFKEACTAFRAKIGRPLTEAEIAEVGNTLRQIRQTPTTAPAVRLPTLAEAIHRQAACKKAGRPLPALYARVIETADPAEVEAIMNPPRPAPRTSRNSSHRPTPGKCQRGRHAATNGAFGR